MTTEMDGGAPPPSDDRTLLLQALAQHIAEFLGQHAPGLDEDAVVDLAMIVAKEQFVIHETILPDLHGERLHTHPTMHMAIMKAQTPDDLGVAIKGAKCMRPDTEIGVATHTAMLLALLHFPSVRALLRANGFAYTFAQSTEVLQTERKIIM